MTRMGFEGVANLHSVIENDNLSRKDLINEPKNHTVHRFSIDAKEENQLGFQSSRYLRIGS